MRDYEVPEGKQRVRLVLGYDGTRFSGWAKQPGRRTVQGILEEALARITRESVATVVAGRTDAGVHARAQEIHFDLSREAWHKMPGRAARPAGEGMVRRLTGALGAVRADDIAIHRASEAPAGFDARFGALWRRYSYSIADAPDIVDPLRRSHTLILRERLDVAAMSAAARSLVGENDFLSFCKPRPGATTIRTLLDFDWQRGPDGMITAIVKADAFCHHMVRAMVGACLKVGQGTRDVTWPQELLANASKESPMYVSRAHGLVLEEVRYPSDALLAERAALTRASRVTNDEAD
ncbi:tRNA pseudouridine(38-40) synthase TruA [Saxibacter everestensis]|uniref:tRNA pseudouridine synthase A n=1 Tax=Saxibacter everestensis TaxID=2909229 RepID=A0ABY8QV30_9MICO|nr:tRNA pseudouridine(38-40) synthase TruA [Brevibacteriaceae bacterium ZFBP1038]